MTLGLLALKFVTLLISLAAVGAVCFQDWRRR